MGLGMLAILAPIQAVVGDFHGLNTLIHQPAKIAAIEGHWDGSKPAPLVLFAWPDQKNERNLADGPYRSIWRLTAVGCHLGSAGSGSGVLNLFAAVAAVAAFSVLVIAKVWEGLIDS